MVHWLACAARRPAPNRGDVSVYGSVCTCRAHRRTPAQSGWPADSTSATRATQNVDDWLTIARRFSLDEYSSYLRPYICAKSVEPDMSRPAGLRVPGTTHCFSEDRGHRATCPWRRQRPSEIVLLILPWRHHFGLRTLGHPRCADLRQEVDIELIRKHHHLMCVEVFVLKPNPSHAFDPVRVVIFGHQLGSIPAPADLMEPAPHGFRRDLDAVFCRQRGGEGRTTPSGAAPAIGPWGFFEYGTQSAREPGP